MQPEAAAGMSFIKCCNPFDSMGQSSIMRTKAGVQDTWMNNAAVTAFYR
jgi:hypothetical protein